MSLRVAVGAPFVSEGRDRLGEHEFVVSLSLDRDWMSPDQATRLVDVATGEGLLERDDGELVATFDLDSVTVPDDYTPDESLFQERSAFETALDAVVSAGADRQETVAAVNALQRDLGVTADVAAVLHARREGVDVAAAARKAGEEL
ncbi:hypothetical protein MBEHAL_2501 [Halarchaeum acidiphilum MH1-52-1]|uniref:DUF2240 family protein n=1 Tax=Halarchaeum acidiphilum MH1-52-1 TaxID=1261545 RepID=U2YH38_9EURY|nr:DUF2240 family protein [Halarchaeum acidiphilum]GAD53741.1 hypothetical protein MBEHAL_2501 [Halarchaeum acidiphilum MH1-52-1]